MLRRILVTLLLITSFILKTGNISASENFNGSEDFDTGITSLMNAVAAKDYKAIEFFIKINPLDINAQNIGEATALHLAVRGNDIIATKILIDSGADVNIKDIAGYSPAMRACFYGYNDVFNILKDNSIINYKLLNNEGDGFIILSALSKNIVCLQETLRNIIPIRDLSIDELKDRLNKAFIISLAKDDNESKELLLKYLNKLQIFQQKVRNLSRINGEFEVQKKNTVSREESEDKNTSGKRVYKLKSGYKSVKIEDKNIADARKAKKKIRYRIKKPTELKSNKSEYKLKNGSKGALNTKPRQKISDSRMNDRDEFTFNKTIIID